MAKFIATATKQWRITIQNANWFTVSYWNKIWSTVWEINWKLANYVWNDPIWYLKRELQADDELDIT